MSANYFRFARHGITMSPQNVSRSVAISSFPRVCQRQAGTPLHNRCVLHSIHLFTSMHGILVQCKHAAGSSAVNACPSAPPPLLFHVARLPNGPHTARTVPATSPGRAKLCDTPQTTLGKMATWGTTRLRRPGLTAPGHQTPGSARRRPPVPPFHRLVVTPPVRLGW